MSQARKLTGTSRLPNMPPMEPTMASSLPNMRVPGYWVAMQPQCRGAEREQREMLPYPLALEALESMAAGVGDRK